MKIAFLGCAAILPTGLSVSPAGADVSDLPTLTAIESTLGTIAGTLEEIATTITTMSAAMSAITPLPPSSGPASALAGTGLKAMADSLVNGIPQGSPEIIAALAGYEAKFELHNAFLLDKATSSADLTATAYKVANGAIAAAVADESFKRANESMLRLEADLAALKTSTSLKRSLDINTRVMIEVGQQLNESIRSQSAMTSLAGIYFMSTGVRATEFNKLLLGIQKYIR